MTVPLHSVLVLHRINYLYIVQRCLLWLTTTCAAGKLASLTVTFCFNLLPFFCVAFLYVISHERRLQFRQNLHTNLRVFSFTNHLITPTISIVKEFQK